MDEQEARRALGRIFALRLPCSWDALDIERAHIAGISYGGELSLAFAHRYPARTRSLVVASTVSQIDPLLAGWMGSWLTAARARDAELLFSVTYPLNFSEAWMAANADLLEAARQRYATLDMDAFLELLLGFSRLSLTGVLHEITAPTLVIVGEDDLLKPRQYAEIIAREIAGAELAVVPHAGHAVSWEQPGLFNTLLLGFVAKHSEGSR